MGLVLLSVWSGYSSMDANRLPRTNPNIIDCIVVLLLMLSFAFGAMFYFRNGRLTRPSIGRLPLSFSRDPLQLLFIFSLCLLGMLLGGCFRIDTVGTAGHWRVAVYASAFMGLLIGQALGYAMFRKHISRSGTAMT